MSTIRFFVSISLVLLFNLSFLQSNEKDSLYRCLKKEQSEEERIKLFLEIAKINFEIQNDTSVLFCQKALELTEGSAELSNKFNAKIFGTLGEAYENVNKEKSIKYFLQSLQLYHKKKNQRMVYEINVRLCIVYTSINKLQEAEKHLLEADKIYEQPDFVDQDYQFEFAKSIYWYTAQNFEKASKAYIKLISQLKHTNKYRRLSQAYLNLGACYYFLNQSDSCVNTCYKALRLDDKYHFMQPAFRINFLNTIAASYLQINRIEDAKKVFNQNIEIARKANINSALIVAYNNYAYSCRLQNEYLESLKALQLAHKLVVNNKYIAERLEIETGIGESLLKLNRIAESIPYIKKALKSAKEIKNISMLIDNYLNLGDALNNHESVDLYKNALKLSEEHELYDQAYKCYEKIIENSVNDKKSKEISSYYKSLLVLKDSMFYSTKFREIQEIETQYETEKKEQQIELLEANNQNQKLSLEKAEQERNMIFAGIGLLLLLTIPVVFFARQRNRNKVLEARINSENKECTRIAKELHDSVSGSLTTIRYLLESGTESNSLVENIKSVSKEVRGISHKLNMGALANQGIKEAVYDALMLNHFPKGINLDINLPTGFEIKDFEVKINFIRILQELVQNTIKYAEASEIKINFEKQKQNITLSYQDNGKGCNLNQISVGNGMRNIEDRVKYIKGTVEIDSQLGNGFYCCIEL